MCAATEKWKHMNIRLIDANETDDMMEAAFIEDLFEGDVSALSGWVDEMSGHFRNRKDNADTMLIHQIRDKFTSTVTPGYPWTPRQYAEFMSRDVLPHCSHLASPTCLGHMTSPLPRFVPEFGRLVQTLNQNMMKMESSRGLTFLERQVLGIVHRKIFGLDETFYDEHLQDATTVLGKFTSGGTIANISALWIAFRSALPDVTNRHQALWQQGYRDAVIIGSDLMHYSFDKGADMLGLSLLRLPTDTDHRIDAEAMKNAIEECEKSRRKVIALLGIAGTTDFGSIDPLPEICELGRRYGIHTHIDAAWGGGLLFCEEGKKLLHGIEGADSVTIDGHKQLMLPIGTGMLFLRCPGMSANVRHHAPYAVRTTSLDQGRFTLEGTRPATALYLHAALHLIGGQGYDVLLSASLKRAQTMARLLESSEAFELASQPVMNIVLYRYIPAALRGRELDAGDNERINHFNMLLQKRQRREGNSFVSRTVRMLHRYPGQPLTLLRAVLLNPLTTERDIEILIVDQLRIGAELEREMELMAA